MAGDGNHESTRGAAGFLAPQTTGNGYVITKEDEENYVPFLRKAKQSELERPEKVDAVYGVS